MEATEDNIALYRLTLLRWYRAGGARSFAWREQENRTPYRAVIAEIMLRRTRADQVEPVYRAFLASYPTLTEALTLDREELRKLFYPLGLEWRAENVASLFDAVRQLSMSDFPTDIGLLESLPGIGDYVSNAVACFSGGERSATLVDTNVVRVLGRLFGLDLTGEARRRRSVRMLAERAVDRENVVDYHYAVLDFAARICIARNPRCSLCPFGSRGQCEYYNNSVGTRA